MLRDWWGHGDYVQPLLELVAVFDQPQFANEWEQFNLSNTRLGRNTGSLNLNIPQVMKKKGNGKGAQPAFGGQLGAGAVAPAGCRHKGKGGKDGKAGPAVGGKGGKDGSKGCFALKYYNRVIGLKGGGINDTRYQIREADVVTLPELFLHLGKWYSAKDLYRFYCLLPELAVTRHGPGR